jgi:hypothetical protein
MFHSPTLLLFLAYICRIDPANYVKKFLTGGKMPGQALLKDELVEDMSFLSKSSGADEVLLAKIMLLQVFGQIGQLPEEVLPWRENFGEEQI